ncbi:CTP synthase [Candidatus Pacebacteria bacterium]|nr:CTP synthase [Candidatus Paceibacterota bacterium]
MAKAKTKTQKTQKQPKYLFVVGGVMSGVGKGIASSSIAKILQGRGLKVTAIKIDPYINVDAGTMNPTEHGEVFVLKDGLETDQDMGNYERFLNADLPAANYMTTGSVYQSVIQKERNLEYRGKNVEVVPDIPLEVIDRIKNAAKLANADVVLTEVGGTVGEYQNVLFLEAIRMMKSKNPSDVGVVMVSYLPVPGSIGEMKTKPTQTAVRTLNSAGVFPDIIIARSPIGVDRKRKEKISTFCNVHVEDVISAPDVESIYDIPLSFEKDHLSDRLCEMLSLPCKKKIDLSEWKKFVTKSKNVKDTVQIAVVGKYFSSGDFILSDVYISVLEAIKYSSYKLGLKPEITYLSSVDFEKGINLNVLKKFDGVLVPGGFGKTGIEGKLKVIEYIRKNKIPYFGICYGLQLAVLEYGRNVLKKKNASTEEINPKAAHLLVGVMPEQREKIANNEMGGTMRLGEYPALLQKGSIAQRSYKKSEITERHRHRYEVNPEYVMELQEGGINFTGRSPDGRLVEIMELPEEVHPFFVAVQFHPELKARPLDPHPLFTAFIKASYESK